MSVKQSRALGPTSDLVVLAPWMDGIIGADEAILPATRFALTFRALFQIRRFAREATEVLCFPDPIERLEQVHSFRVTARPEGMLLSVTYDFGWEPYMRALWQEGRPFLDLLLCNCKGYGLARNTALDSWSAWIRNYEIVSDYFYSSSPLTVGDLGILSQAECVQRETADAVAGDLKLTTFASQPAAETAKRNREREPEIAAQQALRVLAAMHRLTRFYGADTTPGSALAVDAETLLQATRGLLIGWDPTALPDADQERFARELDWYQQNNQPAAAKPAQKPVVNKANVQRGILSGFDDGDAFITHGAALYLMVTDAAAARASLASLDLATEARIAPEDGIFRNLAFTFAGLTHLGMGPGFLNAMSPALREGAAARAGQVGDVRSFHPSNWTRLPGNWPSDSGTGFDIGLVDAVITLRTHAPDAPTAIADPRHPLHGLVSRIGNGTLLPGWALLSVEALGPAKPDHPGFDHFGFRDGISQPVLDEDKAQQWSDTVSPGELLLGYATQADAALPGGMSGPDFPLIDSSLLAIRRVPMRPDRFKAMLDSAATASKIDSDIIAAKIVGRKPDGTPLVVGNNGLNDFRYTNDAGGALCPMQSHVRRANPRTASRGNSSAGLPRIVRRGMSFGPPADGDPSAERGSLFMAYCANLSEQYEVILHWINGGNSTRTGSFVGDPLTGVPDAIDPRTYRFNNDGHPCRISLPVTDEAFIGLSWSLYLLAPSIELVRRIAATRPAPRARVTADPFLIPQVRALIKSLRDRNALEAEWRVYLDEPGARERGIQTAMWQLIRTEHGGILPAYDGHRPTLPSPLVPGGAVIPVASQPRQDMILVGNRDAILTVMRDDGRIYSVKGAGGRIAGSIEKFHLGLDAWTDDYKREGGANNAALRAISENDAFEISRTATGTVLGRVLSDHKAPARIDLVKHLLEPAVAEMAPHWFGLPDGEFIAPGASDWRGFSQRGAMFPGDFWNSSRFAFNPFESAETKRLSAVHGREILKQAEAWVNRVGRDTLSGIVTKQLAIARSGIPGDPDLAYPTERDLARGIVGAMLGWVATTLGNGARLLDAWTTAGILQRKQVGWLATAQRDYFAAVRLFDADMNATISRAPVPECKWREAASDGVTLGTHRLRKDTKVVLGLASAAAEFPEDTHIWFGMAAHGDATPHGCPGRDMALGVLLGVLAALSETVTLRPTGARLEVEITALKQQH
jgi:hypothetical protein